MDLLAQLFIVLHVANPFAIKAMPNFYVAPVAVTIEKAAYTTGARNTNLASLPGKQSRGDSPAAPVAAPVYTKDSPPPQGWDATNAPGMGVTCWSTTQCLNEYYGVSNDGGQPGYLATCPDGAEAQGSCQTPGGEK